MPSVSELIDKVREFGVMFDQELRQAEELSSDQQGAFNQLKHGWLGRKGLVAGLTPELGKLADESERKSLALEIQALRKRIEDSLAAKLAARPTPAAGAVDITLPGRRPAIGYRHPLNLVREEVQEIFTRLGYQVLEGPEIEDDYHNFEALNMPAEHPARDMQDTLYLTEPLPPRPSDDTATSGRSDGLRQGYGRPPKLSTKGEDRLLQVTPPQPLTLLRTHTSPMQIRHMERHPPPVRLIAIGPVYRRDNLDLTHSPMFHQVEGLVVGSQITLADLKGTLLSMAKALFGEAQDIRFRPSFFPYTEPSAEVDIRCVRCQGVGCAVCKRTGWVEILGSGMVHPAVFENVGYEPKEVTGFAFGMGIERVAQLKWDVDDIRLFYENDLRFLEQFGL